jgi:cation transport ATPase
MFDLEQSIADWRKQMLAAGIKTPVPLEELEIHLREEVERQMKSGTSEQNAFEISTQQIGTADKMKNEFEKVEQAKELREWKFIQFIFFVGFGLISAFIITCIIFKFGTFALTYPAQRISGLLAVAVMLFFAGAGYFGCGRFPVIRKKRTRIGVSILGAMPMALWWAIFFFVILQRAEFTMDRLVIAILWGFVAPYGVLAGFVIGLERAVWKNADADSIAAGN